MSYLKGGSVVDGNLYVEGDLVVHNVKNSIENAEWAYILSPSDIKKHIPLIDDSGDGQLSSSGLVVSDDPNDPKYLVIKVDTKRNKNNSESSESSETTSNESGHLKLDVYASRINLSYQDNAFSEIVKNCLYGLTSSGSIIAEGKEEKNKYKPITDPAFWGYQDFDTVNTTLDTITGTPVYTIPDADIAKGDKGGILVDETVLLTGESPINDGV